MAASVDTWEPGTPWSEGWEILSRSGWGGGSRRNDPASLCAGAAPFVVTRTVKGKSFDVSEPAWTGAATLRSTVADAPGETAIVGVSNRNVNAPSGSSPDSATDASQLPSLRILTTWSPVSGPDDFVGRSSATIESKGSTSHAIGISARVSSSSADETRTGIS